MAAGTPGTRALAQAIAAVDRAVEVLKDERDDADYEAGHAKIMLETARVKHISRKHISVEDFKAEIAAAAQALET